MAEFIKNLKCSQLILNAQVFPAKSGLSPAFAEALKRCVSGGLNLFRFLAALYLYLPALHLGGYGHGQFQHTV